MNRKKSKSNESAEHVLVCLSPSPTNRKIIDAAAKLAKAFHAQFTALYVSKPQERNLLPEEQTRLQNNIRYAEDLGAAITTVIGENISFQIAEFARISGVTKIVIGRSNTGRYHFWERQTITEQLIAIAPNIDIYIIPDSKTTIKENRKKRLAGQFVPTGKDLVITACMLLAVTGLGLCFSMLGFTESNIITVYILGVLLSAVLTRSHLCSLISSLSSVLLFNYFFTEPRFTFHAYEPGYSVTFIIMLIAALLTGSLAYRLKDNARESARSAYRTKVLFDTNQLLQKSRTYNDVLQVMANQIILLLDKDVIIYPVESEKLGKGYIYAKDASGNNALSMDESESDVVQWVFENRKRAGATTKIFPKAKCLYLAVHINETIYGIVGIHVEKKTLSSFEYSILLSILGECAIALENLDNEKAKEEAALIAQNEKLRANLLRTISHDLRTPLTSISGNASNLCNHYKMLDDETREQMFSDIYDDSEWLIRLVENLLSVTRIENGEMQLNKSLEVMDDVVEEALKHIDRDRTEHDIRVSQCGDLVIANMDAKLITQVIINIVNNAIKYTQQGSVIQVDYGNEDDMVYMRISDNGPGMDANSKEHAFDMFYTGQNKIADSKRSMGLGLALCKSVVEAHGGRIEITDNDPSGCICTFYLEKGDISINE
jgi:Osmosensitive K+ channel histidine kinase